MTNLQLVKSENFGSVQCDFYGNGKNEFYMTREQIGRSLEYKTDPANAIAKIHQRHADRLDKFSGVVRLSTPSGTQETTVYTRKGIMEICRWSQQPGADAFMDWVWEIMDGLMSGRLKLSAKPAHKKLPLASFNHLMEINVKRMEAADEPATHIAAWVNGMTRDALGQYGIDVPALPDMMPRTYDATEMAKEIGVYSKNGNPHARAITAIIKEVGLAPGETFTTETTVHGGRKDVPDVRYAESVLVKVNGWINGHGGPNPITLGGKNYNVQYQ